ncbi:hypothetical protein EH240_25965 [Mesorhizobium tamadayense]|uniref:DUF3606 domain-containing protein n=1 Tax=Mesorhizobium tamadayense TaxID=425306 RepID=A0A3P3F8S7_9HYPH|nr:hypothetical protein [Mesorhizobium tamadayense]RRH94985.1 hypothetical protein EH240_25965 [Mesorhizobium tamadayense]
MKHIAALTVSRQRKRHMAGDDRKAVSQMEPDVELHAHRPARDTDISEGEARELIKLIGTDWLSLLREARFLKSRH